MAINQTLGSLVVKQSARPTDIASRLAELSVWSVGVRLCEGISPGRLGSESYGYWACTVSTFD
jgi:hypothetical protein